MEEDSFPAQGEQPNEAYEGTEPPPTSTSVMTSISHANSRSTGELVKEIAADISKLFRMEVDLAKQEISELVKEKARGGILVLIGATLALLIIPMVLLTSMEVLAIWLERWAAALIVTGALLLGAAMVLIAAKKYLSSKFVPEKTIQSIKEDVEWVKSRKKP